MVECTTCNTSGYISVEEDHVDMSGHHWTSTKCVNCSDCDGEGYVKEKIANCSLEINIPIRPANGLSLEEIQKRALSHLAWELGRDLWNELIDKINWDIDYDNT